MALQKPIEAYLDECREKHNNFYTYPENQVINNVNDKIEIYCPNHGYFSSTLASHKHKYGCKKCAVDENARLRKQRASDKFVKEANEVHNNAFQYPESYINARTPMRIFCPRHGDFWQTPNAHLRGKGCKKCAKIVSKPEMELHDFVESLGYEIIKNSRTLIGKKEIDLYIPSLKKAIEYNGQWWHYDHTNERCKPKGYHAEKSNLCRAQGITLLHIREELWLKDKDKMKKVIGLFINKN